jgi:hypothetical protein
MAQNTTFTVGGANVVSGFAQADKFLLSFTRLPQMTILCQKSNIPEIAVNPAFQPTPGANAPIPGNKFQYGPFIVTFILDEQMWAWSTIYDWLSGIGFPESSSQYKNLPLQQRLLQTQQPQYSDAILTYYSNINNPVLQYHFTDMFPVGLSSVQFDVSQPATQTMYGTATFRFTDYNYKRYTY